MPCDWFDEENFEKEFAYEDCILAEERELECSGVLKFDENLFVQPVDDIKQLEIVF